MTEDNEPCCGKPGCCGSGPNRRDFLRFVGLGAVAAALAPQEVAAESPGAVDLEKLVPADKKLSPEWVKSLFARGKPERCSGQELKYIGMPIGGIACGQLYVGGDGKLWAWDIFNRPVATSKFDEYDGVHYVTKPEPHSIVEQGFVLQIKAGDKIWKRNLDKTGFKDITFRGEYPIATITYRDPELPVEVVLEAFSPFIPFQAKDSAIPATIMSFQVKNISQQPLDVSVAGWLENAVRRFTGNKDSRCRVNQWQTLGRHSLMTCTWNDGQAEKDAERKTPQPDVVSEKAVDDEDYDHGSMALMLLDGAANAQVNLELTNKPAADTIFPELGTIAPGHSRSAGGKGTPVAAMAQSRILKPGEETRYEYVMSWYFPSLAFHGRQRDLALPRIANLNKMKRHYAAHYGGAGDVSADVARRFKELTGATRLWRDTWYESTLPYWLLDRLMIPTDCLATQTTAWFDNGRFYGWEGTYCCGGTCTHVWQYAQAMGRLFPELERSVRAHVDFNPSVGQHSNGGIRVRGESQWIAIDGHCGRILCMYREYLNSTDDRFLKELWPQVRKAIDYMIRQDGNADGILEGEQHNTLDAPWYGPSSWLSSLYIAAMAASAKMAETMGETDFARTCAAIAERGGEELKKRLFNGEYFIHKPDPAYPKANRSGNGCEIDQVMGQSWAYQVGLGRILPEKETRQALQSLWKYNFTPDVGPFREHFKDGRWYAVAGEGGLIMCTFPKGDTDILATGDKRFGAYFNECMTGFEYQVASHMIFEGTPDLVEKGLAIIRTIHDRYAPSRRNPYNEVECSDHYARAMAAYGAFIAITGFEYHGPNGHIGFAPRLTPENFKAAFTSAEGWGTFSQKREGAALRARVELKRGRLHLKTLALAVPEKARPKRVSVKIGGATVGARHGVDDGRITITLASETVLAPDKAIEVLVTW